MWWAFQMGLFGITCWFRGFWWVSQTTLYYHDFNLILKQGVNSVNTGQVKWLLTSTTFSTNQMSVFS